MAQQRLVADVERARKAMTYFRAIRQYCREIERGAAALLPENIDELGDEANVPWTTVAELARIERELYSTADRLMGRGEFAPDAKTECPL